MGKKSQDLVFEMFLKVKDNVSGHLESIFITYWLFMNKSEKYLRNRIKFNPFFDILSNY